MSAPIERQAPSQRRISQYSLILGARRRAIKHQLRRAGIPIPAAILLDTRALRALRASS